MGTTCSRGTTLAENIENVGQRPRFQSFDSKVRHVWDDADVNKDGVMTFSEVKKMIHKLNALIPDRELKRKFREFDADNNGELDFEEFKSLWESVQSLPPLEEQFTAAAGGKTYMTADELRRFLALSSMTIKTEYECAKLILRYEGATQDEIDKCERDDDFSEFPSLFLNGFLRFLSNGNENSIALESVVHKVYQDMTQPLSHYYISSSHNTYLSGNQLNSASTPDAITAALKRGVRVVELDCWDGPNGSDPIVNHGHTLCTPTSFESCLQAIKEAAFIKSEYPVIITIENHCSHNMQLRQADILTSIFGDTLYLWEGRKGDCDEGMVDFTLGPITWLSPEELKGRIIVRDKPTRKHHTKPQPTEPMYEQLEENKKTDTVEAVEVAVKVSADVKVTAADVEQAVSGPNQLTESPTDSAPEIPEPQDVNVDTSEVDEEEEDSDSRLTGVAPELVKLIYIRNVKLRSVPSDKYRFEHPPYATSSSINESKMMKLTKPGSAACALTQYTCSHLVRVYPGGKRIDSSNYDPIPAWNAGCQIVALNYQSFNDPVLINQAKFADNGGSGYVLKPKQMLSETTTWDALIADKGVDTRTLTLSVISGHYLPKPLGASASSEVIDPYVMISVNGMQDDQAAVSTKVVNNNGFNPVWKETFSFDISVPELANVVFKVYDHDVLNADDFIGYFGVPVVGIAPGFHVVPLMDKYGAPLVGAFLFVQVTWSPSPPQRNARDELFAASPKSQVSK